MPHAHPFFPEVGRGGLGTIEAGVQTVDETSGDPIDLPSGSPSLGHHSYLGASLSRAKLAACFAVFFLMFGALAARAAYLELGRGAMYRRQAEGNRLRIAEVPAARGVVYDRNGTLLVRNVPDFALTITPADLPKDRTQRNDLIVRLAEAVGITPVDIEEALRNYPPNLASAVPIQDHLDYEQALRLEIQSGRLPGVAVERGTKRELLLQPEGITQPVLSLSHLIGYEGRINEAEYAALKSDGYLPTDAIGKTGIEASYERQLRGSYGKKQIEVDAFGREQDVLASDEPVQGMDLTLTVDAKLQAEAERSLRASSARNGRGRGSAIALDPKTGEVLALVSWPAYDANAFARGITTNEYRALTEDPNHPLFPRAVAGTFPPGSTVKTIIASAGLMEGVITPSTTVRSTGGIRVGPWFFPDWKAGGHGITNVTKAIAQSVNTFFYAVGGGWDTIEGLGIDRLVPYFRRFGLGAKLGIDLPGEATGFVPTAEWKERVKNEAWYIGDTYHVSIGQGDLTVTPLQVAAWTSLFANGGNLVRPYVVKQVHSAKTIDQVNSTPLKTAVVPPDVLATVRQGMRETILSGSAQGLKISPWTIAGKTGTAQWGNGEPTHAWFAGFAPYNDPRIAVVVMVEAGGEGTTAAAPVARDIMEAWLRSQGVKPDNGAWRAPIVASASATAP